MPILGTIWLTELARRTPAGLDTIERADIVWESQEIWGHNTEIWGHNT
jgi:hypothetical protein